MKLRIQGNSIRMRLTKPEVEQFDVHGSIEDTCTMPGGELTFGLKKAGETVDCAMKDHKITVFVPEDIADKWTKTERVGFRGRSGNTEILIEKDFKCLSRNDEGDEFYENPYEKSAGKKS
jgi:hypothetical protein